MCREDLGLGRGRISQPAVRATGTSVGLLGADPRRVAILVSFSGYAFFDSAGSVSVLDVALLFAGDSLSGVPILQLSAGVGPIVLRIEDVGNLVTEAMSASVTNASGNAGLVLVPITSTVKQDAITD